MPALAGARQSEVVIVRRSGHRSVLAADVLQTLGYTNVVSLKTGVRGWNDYELPLFNAAERRPEESLNDAGLTSSSRLRARRPSSA